MLNRRTLGTLFTFIGAWAMMIAPVGLSVQAQKAAPSSNPKLAPTVVYPRSVDLAGGKALVYAPQVESWDGKSKIVAWSAVSYQPTGARTKPSLGTIKIEADTRVALEERIVNFSPLRVTESNFPSLSREQAQAVTTGLQVAFSPDERTIELDRVITAVDKSQLKADASNSNGLKADPPKIHYSSTPSIFVIFDGQPIWSPIRDNELKWAVNTNWDVFQYPPTKTYYLRNNSVWLQTTDINGVWTPTNNLPASFSKLSDDDNWKEVKASIGTKSFSNVATPLVIVSYEPAEIIATTGAPKYTQVPGTSLLWVSNTESDIFRAGPTGLFYYLVAGRWFSAASLQGPWTFATPTLPEDFKKISAEHPRSRVLASVPGTDQAAQAVVLASIPQTAEVNFRTATAPEVIYQGAPEFVPIATTPLFRAVNTDKDIIKFGDVYYMCFEGVWFRSTGTSGPWEVCKSVPNEIYTIPPSDPLYHVTFVKVGADQNPDDDWVVYESSAGYSGMMVGWGCAVWETGWYYPPYYGYGGYYPWYIWYPPTYGFAAWYNPYTGTFGRGAAVYGPYGGAGVWGAYNPRTGTYARGAAAYGPWGGTRSFAQAWNPRTGTYAQTRQGTGVYGNWGSSFVKRGDNWARTGHITNDVTGSRTSGVKTSNGGALVTRKTDDGRTTIAKGPNGDVYAGKDGNVYRKQDGQWQKWDDGGWNSVNKPEQKLNKVKNTKTDPATMDQLKRDNVKRIEGERRAQEQKKYEKSLGGRNNAGSFRSGGFRGGGFRGGGRRR